MYLINIFPLDISEVCFCAGEIQAWMVQGKNSVLGVKLSTLFKLHKWKFLKRPLKHYKHVQINELNFPSLSIQYARYSFIVHLCIFFKNSMCLHPVK